MTQEECKIETSKHINMVNDFINIIIDQLNLRAKFHDATKLESPELEIFTEYTPKLKDMTYGSPEYKDCMKHMGEALQHHYSHNKHHPEYHAEGIRGMTLVDIIEMISDWKAATLRHTDGDIMKSIEFNQNRFNYSDDLKQIFINTAKLFNNDIQKLSYELQPEDYKEEHHEL